MSFLSTCPSHRSLRWTTLSSRVVWLLNACLMSSLLIFVCLVITPAILKIPIHILSARMDTLATVTTVIHMLDDQYRLYQLTIEVTLLEQPKARVHCAIRMYTQNNKYTYTQTSSQNRVTPSMVQLNLLSLTHRQNK